MIETQEAIAKWATQTFGSAVSLSRVAARANEEMAELLRATTGNADGKMIAQEAADVVIVLFRLAELCGQDLLTLVDEKMQINRARVWKKDETGHGYHVRDKVNR
jgi:NTP pyrophosphatase (non-canonical NTP hydrolase)